MALTNTATATIHDLLRSWRGGMKLDRAAVYLGDQLHREVSRETIRRYEVAQEAPRYLDPVLLAGLARVYGHDPAELPADIVADLKRIAAVIDLGTAAKVNDATGLYVKSPSQRRRLEVVPTHVQSLHIQAS